MKKTVYIKSFGCQMNDTDSEQLLGILGRCGYAPTSQPEGADLILLNTCAIRAKAEQKVFSDLGRLKRFKTEDPQVKIGVAGCMAQAMGKKILSREPAVDFVLGTRSMGTLPGLLQEVLRGNKRVSVAPVDEFDDLRSVTVRASAVHAYVPIIYGCENYCSYCVVPYVRGRERSRPVEAILTEMRDLADRGYKEVTLLGQNVNSYGKKSSENIDFCKLLHLAHDVRGIERIRFVTSHPRDLSAGMIRAMAELSKVCEALHLPVQSGSDRVLEAMNRGYTRAQYLEKASLLRQEIPGIAITTDLIVGFPGESERDFQETLSLLEEVEFDHLFGFRFSPRPGTPASVLPDGVAEEIAAGRLDDLFRLQKRISLKKHQSLVGETLEVLVEGPGKKDPSRLTGRTRSNKIVHFAGPPSLVGKIVQVKIERGLPNCLIGAAHPPAGRQLSVDSM